jgi:hypothetical protein
VIIPSKKVQLEKDKSLLNKEHKLVGRISILAPVRVNLYQQYSLKHDRDYLSDGFFWAEKIKCFHAVLRYTTANPDYGEGAKRLQALDFAKSSADWEPWELANALSELEYINICPTKDGKYQIKMIYHLGWFRYILHMEYDLKWKLEEDQKNKLFKLKIDGPLYARLRYPASKEEDHISVMVKGTFVGRYYKKPRKLRKKYFYGWEGETYDYEKNK